jgi:hypothetical protein
VVCKSQYCSYSHLSAMLERTGTDWLIGMFEVYLDDSGTDSTSDIAIAACYISTKGQWDEFVKEWDSVRIGEGFDAFHMVDFAASHDPTKKPFCDWKFDKRERVYNNLARIINDRKRIGIASAVPKKAYEEFVPERHRRRHGFFHYTFAVRSVLMRIRDWRRASGITIPMRFVFDRMSQGKHEIIDIWKQREDIPEWEEMFGMEPDGYSFEDKKFFKPLQAADILAWQMQNHMKKVIVPGKHDVDDCHRRFLLLRDGQNMDLGWYTEAQLKSWVKRIEEHDAIHGPAY